MSIIKKYINSTKFAPYINKSYPNNNAQERNNCQFNAVVWNLCAYAHFGHSFIINYTSRYRVRYYIVISL